MSDGWDESAQAWIASMGERGDWSREHVLDAAMLGRIGARRFRSALDVGCGEGRFCRILQQRGIATVGVDPTAALLEEARRRDPAGRYVLGRAEALEFADGCFDLVVSYLTLIDIADFRSGIREMARVLQPGGTLLIANLTSFTTACAAQGWVTGCEWSTAALPGRPLSRRISRMGELGRHSPAELASPPRRVHARLSRRRPALALLRRARAGQRRCRARRKVSARAMVRRDGMGQAGG